TAIANDYSFDRVFARQVEALGQPGDLLIVVSTSGNSVNCIRATQAAHKRGMRTVALLGNSGGALLEHVELALSLPSKDTPSLQEIFLLVEHALCMTIEELLFGTPT